MATSMEEDLGGRRVGRTVVALALLQAGIAGLALPLFAVGDLRFVVLGAASLLMGGILLVTGTRRIFDEQDDASPAEEGATVRVTDPDAASGRQAAARAFAGLTLSEADDAPEEARGSVPAVVLPQAAETSDPAEPSEQADRREGPRRVRSGTQLKAVRGDESLDDDAIDSTG